LQKNIELARYS